MMDELVDAAVLHWNEIHSDRGDGDSEVVGWEAETPFNTWYKIEMGFGSDSYCFSVHHEHDFIASFDDPNWAKAGAAKNLLERALSAIQEDAVIVPREPTEAMILAAKNAGYIFNIDRTENDAIGWTFEAMLEASPYK